MNQTPTVLISNLRVQNYRSLAEIDLPLEPLTAFVGPNGVGKSNLVDVFRFLVDTLTLGLDSAISKRGGINALRRWSAKGRPHDIEIELKLNGTQANSRFNAKFILEIRASNGGEFKIKREACVVELLGAEQPQQNAYEIRNGQWVTQPNFSVLQTAAPDLPPEEFAKLTNIPVTRLYLPQAFAPEFLIVAWVLRGFGIYKIEPEALRTLQSPVNPTPLLEDAHNLASTLHYLKQDKKTSAQAIIEALPKVTAGMSDFSVKNIGGYLVTRLHHGMDGPMFPLAQESDGTLRALALLTALYQDPPRTLLIVEEPELNLHPGALGVLCDLFREASQRSQIILTTHSPDLLYHFPVDSLRVVEMQEGLTLVGPIAKHQREAIIRKLFAPGELMRIEGLQRASTNGA